MQNPFPLAGIMEAILKKKIVEIEVSSRRKNYHYILIILITSNSRKIVLAKKILFPYVENPFVLAKQRMLKNKLIL